MKEKILIMAVKKPEQKDDRFQSSLDELVSLSRTAGGTVVEIVTQNRQSIHPATYIGLGKVQEIRSLVEEHDIDLVISNDELSPGQLRNIGEELDTPLIDRNQLILDIFARRAKTKEGQLQVELAQLEYTLPRLYGQGLVLSRLGGGIGTRGPGETKLETDQRHIRRKIVDIKRRLEVVVKQREQYRKRRKLNHVYQIAIVGYTNAGKSTIFNRLTDSESLEEDLLFATLDPLTRSIELPSGFEVLLTDTVGFIQDLPTTLVASFRSTLEEVTEADFILHVVDGSHSDRSHHEDTVNNLLEELEAENVPMLTVYNKSDLFGEEFIPLSHPYIVTNAFEENDLNELIHKVEELLKDSWYSYEVELTPKEGKELHQLQRESIVISQEYDEGNNRYIVKGYIREEHPLFHKVV